MAKVKSPKKPTRKPKDKSVPVSERTHLEQSWIPGTEPETIPEVEQAVLAYQEAKEEEKDAKNEFKARVIEVMDKMRKHDLDQYQTAEGFIYKINHKAALGRKKKKKTKPVKEDC